MERELVRGERERRGRERGERERERERGERESVLSYRVYVPGPMFRR